MSASGQRRAGPAVAVLILALLVAVLPAGRGDAVAHGRRVAHPERTVPWVVTLYLGPGGGGASPEDLVCTGTALDPRTILTAAHCLEDLGADVITAGYGGATLAGQQQVDVVAHQMHPSYDPWVVVHDLAVLRTAAPMAIDSFPTLPTAGQAARARTSSARFTLYGWGDVRSGRVTGRLHLARMANRSRQAKRIWGSDFGSNRQLGAGGLPHSARRSYPGACAGDSGGPLVMAVRGAPVVVGVTSYGVRRCGAASPTIFTAVGHYTRWIRDTAAALSTSEPVPADPAGEAPLPADPDLAAGLP